ncbi:MAG: elongation factor 4 [Chloroflexi bacterium]|nr:elongation factor 4 [Chloroflexota bacterium]
MNPRYIRNFCIIAHIDHGKSTLADRLLEYTGTISPREMKDQLLDDMDLERERGITIKAKAVRLSYDSRDGQTYELNLIDTPGHVDFSYEVSRSLSACEGAVLVIDASQGIQAQTLANVYMAMDQGLELIPVVNKIDLPGAEPERIVEEIETALGYPASEVLLISAKEGLGIEEVLEAVVERVPAPGGDGVSPLRALIFDSKYDSYKGVIAYVRIFEGSVAKGQVLKLMSNGTDFEVLEVTMFEPSPTPVPGLGVGEVGGIATGLKDVSRCRVGDTLTDNSSPADVPLPGYRSLKPMVFAGLYPIDTKDHAFLKDGLDKLTLNDASLSYEPEESVALGPGFRCGFLGLLHMEIVQERLEREYGLDLITTSPSVAYRVNLHNGDSRFVESPSGLPAVGEISDIEEPWLDLIIIAPDRYIGAVMELVKEHRGKYTKMEYLTSGPGDGAGAGHGRVSMEFQMPLAELLVDFYDRLKSRTQGYASLDYTVSGYKVAPLVKLDVLVNGQPVDALSLIVHSDQAQRRGRALVQSLRSLIPRQMFDVPVQAAVGSRVIARETIKAMRKNVLAKCYGGDVTRKRKLLEKQAAGKKRMKRVGNVEIPQEAFMVILKLGK